MARHPLGSTPLLTAGLIKVLTDAIRNGAYVETAAALCGISKQTFYRWLKQAEEDNAPNLIQKLSDAVKKSMAESEMRDLAVIDQAGQNGQWQASAWRLERKHPEKWGRKALMQIEHSGPDKGPIVIEEQRKFLVKVLTDPDALLAAEVIAERLALGADSKE
jgi:transposase